MPTSITGNSISLGSGGNATSITNAGILNHAGTLQLGDVTIAVEKDLYEYNLDKEFVWRNLN